MSGLTNEQRRALTGRGNNALNAYYYSFEPTGCEPIDLILMAVAYAGKLAHSTEDWYQGDHWKGYGGTPVEFIQAAAVSAAESLGAIQRAFTDPGPVPRHHERMKDKLAHEWPALHHALSRAFDPRRDT